MAKYYVTWSSISLETPEYPKKNVYLSQIQPLYTEFSKY